MAREAIEFECLDVRKRFRGAKSGYIWDGRVSAQIQEHAVAVQSALTAVVQADGLWSDEGALPEDELGTACPVLVHVHADETVNHPPLAGPHLSHFNRCRWSTAAEIAVMTDKVGHFRTVDHVFRRQAGDVRA